MQSPNEKEAIKLIKEFIGFIKTEKKCQSFSIDSLKTFDFEELNLIHYNNKPRSENRKNLRKFRGCSDPDNMNIVKAFYILLWKNILPDISFCTINSSSKYRGDTINSFSSLCKNNDENEEFYKVYHTIGNFILLPNERLVLSNCYSMTINKYRSNLNYDNFNLFLAGVLKVYYDKKVKGEEKILEYELIDNKKWERWDILLENNSFFFNKHENIKDYLEAYSLDMYKKELEQCTEYHKDNVEGYKSLSKERIENRGNILIENLIKDYPELKNLH